MSKSDLKARPIYHHKGDSIEVHLTVVLATLAVVRHIEAVAGISTKNLSRRSNLSGQTLFLSTTFPVQLSLKS